MAQFASSRTRAYLALRTPEAEAVPVESPRGQLRFRPELDRLAPVPRRRTADELSFLLNALAVVALMGIPVLAFVDSAVQVSDEPASHVTLREDVAVAGTPAHPTLGVIARQKGYVNEPLPLGIWINGSSGKESVTVSGLAKHAELSLGSALGTADWLLSADDLDKTFVGPPIDFVGVMDATVKLNSASGQVLESQLVEFEWIAKKEDAVAPSRPAELATVPAPVILSPPDPTVTGAVPVVPSLPTSVAAPSDPAPPPPLAPVAAVPAADVPSPSASVAAPAEPVVTPPPAPVATAPAADVPSPPAPVVSSPLTVVPSSPAPAAAIPEPIAPSPQAPLVTGVVPVVVSLNADQIAALLKVGEKLLQSGDIAAARTVLKRAASAGSASAALELGMSYDQTFLAQWGVVGFKPDLAQARAWYDRAAKLGSTEASRQLERLASMPK